MENEIHLKKNASKNQLFKPKFPFPIKSVMDVYPNMFYKKRVINLIALIFKENLHVIADFIEKIIECRSIDLEIVINMK